MKRFITAFVLVFLTASVGWAYGEVRFASFFNYDEHSLVLKGTGTKRVLFMRAFSAAFYLDDQASAKYILEDVSKRLEVVYFVSIMADQLSNYTESLMKLNLTQPEFDALKGQLPLMRQYFVNLRPGDRYALTYIPQVGTRFEHNGRLIGVIPGETFAKGVFATWLGNRPMDKALKRKILGL